MQTQEALSNAILALNTLKHPDATSDEDFAALDAGAEDAIESLVKLRDAIHGVWDVSLLGKHDVSLLVSVSAKDEDAVLAALRTVGEHITEGLNGRHVETDDQSHDYTLRDASWFPRTETLYATPEAAAEATAGPQAAGVHYADTDTDSPEAAYVAQHRPY